jgi:DNA excision repair protein ERCC-3
MRLKPVEVELAPIRRKRPIQTLIEYKPNHEQLPILILPDNNLLVYTTCPCYKTIYNYLISFSEPVNRPRSIHEYRISKFSLYTAMVLEYTAS